MDLLLDTMLGGLRSYLRMCGHDAAYSLDRGLEDDQKLLELARSEGRTLLTRDRELAARAEESILVESLDVERQLRELRDDGLDLTLAEPPSRCGRCNGRLVPLARDTDRPEYVPDDVDDAWRCRDCGQCFWKGSHWADVRKTLASL